jgi:SpoVK/Ycf46/Vps4 family AAA+-type ATPase
MSGLVLEDKGDFCHQFRGLMQQHGRADDYLEISLDAPDRYNPLHNENILISGGTGTGKTTVLNALADLLRAGECRSGPACGSCRTCGSRRGARCL